MDASLTARHALAVETPHRLHARPTLFDAFNWNRLHLQGDEGVSSKKKITLQLEEDDDSVVETRMVKRRKDSNRFQGTNPSRDGSSRRPTGMDVFHL